MGVQMIGDWQWKDPETFDYQEGPTPPTPPGPYPYEAVIRKGAPLYNENGYQYPNGTSADRNITVEGEQGDRYKIWGKTFTPNEVYCNKSDIKGQTPYPFKGIVKKGSPLYNAYGYKYPNGASANRPVEVQGELNGRYKVWGQTFNPHVVYCDKSSII